MLPIKPRTAVRCYARHVSSPTTRAQPLDPTFLGLASLCLLHRQAPERFFPRLPAYRRDGPTSDLCPQRRPDRSGTRKTRPPRGRRGDPQTGRGRELFDVQQGGLGEGHEGQLGRGVLHLSSRRQGDGGDRLQGGEYRHDRQYEREHYQQGGHAQPAPGGHGCTS
jgi:hypothetical protein